MSPATNETFPIPVAAARARALAEHQTELTVVLNPDRRVTYASAALEAITGEQEKDVMGSPFEFILDQPSRIEFRRAVDRLLHEPAGHGQSTHLQLRTRAALTGNGRSISCVLANRLDDPNLRGLVLTARDLGPAERAQARRLRFRERLLELAIQPKSDFTQALSTILRTAAEVLDVGSASFWRLSRDPDALRCESLFDRKSERFQREWVGREFSSVRFPTYFAPLNGRQPVIVNDTRTSKLTTLFSGDPEWSHVRAVLDAPVLVEGEIVGVLSLRHQESRYWDEDDVSFANTTALMLALAVEAAQRQEAETRIEHLAWYDGLTGLPNRNLLRETMRDMIMTAANRKRRMAVMLIDLDRFKDVNDTLGHLVGDALIKSAAELLRETVADAGVVARLGGDEFVVLVSEFVHRQEVALLAARVAQALHRTDLVPNIDTQVSASIGVALFPEHGRDMSTLLKNADAAMYQAKRDGRNQFSFFNPIRYERAAREVQLGIELVKALQGDCNQFICEYQPQLEMTSGRVVGLDPSGEALSYCRDRLAGRGQRHIGRRRLHRPNRGIERPVVLGRVRGHRQLQVAVEHQRWLARVVLVAGHPQAVIRVDVERVVGIGMPLGDDQAVAVTRPHQAVKRSRRERAVGSAGFTDQFQPRNAFFQKPKNAVSRIKFQLAVQCYAASGDPGIPQHVAVA